jgi:cytochrome c peroxidase
MFGRRLLLVSAAVAHAGTLPVPLGLDRYVPAPESNPLTRAKVEFGRALFFSKDLSADRTVACATCHDPQRAFTDNRALAVGIKGQTSARRTPPILNRAWGKSFFWDGRAATLEQQVLQPIINPKEMGLAHSEIAARAGAGVDEVVRALASYVRTILAGDSPYDQYVAGRHDALSADALAGLRLFRGKANCVACHLGPNLTDERLHNTGIGWKEGRWADAGQGAGAFKTPTLREVARAAPYMHDGSLKTLEEVIDFYDQGGRANPQLDPEIQALKLSAEEKRTLAEFLRSLSGRIQEGWRE